MISCDITFLCTNYISQFSSELFFTTVPKNYSARINGYLYISIMNYRKIVGLYLFILLIPHNEFKYFEL